MVLVILSIILITKKRKRDKSRKNLEEKNKGNIEIEEHTQPQFVIDGTSDEAPAVKDLAKIQEKLVKERQSESLSDGKKANLKRNSKIGRKKSIIAALG